jgi:hypothetical protein
MYAVLTKKQQERLLSLICKKIALSGFINLLSENKFDEFKWGILGEYSFGLLQKLLQNYETENIDKTLRTYLNKFHDNLSYCIYDKATEYFRQFNCLDVIIEQEQQYEKEQKEKEERQQQSSTLALAINLRNALSYKEIQKAGQQEKWLNEDNNSENEQLRQIVFDSIMNVINETDQLFLEMIRLSWFAARLETIHDYILSKDKDLTKQLLEKCRKVMASLRKVLACQGEEEKKKLATEASQYAFCLILDYSGYGKVMKSYILALRYAVDPLVSADLKCIYHTISVEIFRRLQLRKDDEVSNY